MANIASMFKGEITRLARKEIRSEIEGLRKASAQYRSEIAALKRRVATLEQQVLRSRKAAPQTAKAGAAPEAAAKVRFTAKGFKSQRQRLGLTAEALGSLLGVSGQTVYNWETEKSHPRQQQLVRIAALRGMGKREAGKLLSQAAE